MIAFDAAHEAVHYPPDRRFRIWIRPSVVKLVFILLALPVAAAWIEFGLAGLPEIASVPQVRPDNFAGPNGFPLWVPGAIHGGVFRMAGCLDLAGGDRDFSGVGDVRARPGRVADDHRARYHAMPLLDDVDLCRRSSGSDLPWPAELQCGTVQERQDCFGTGSPGQPYS
jgi:hypothetical protein